jgi:hypothetical protein
MPKRKPPFATLRRSVTRPGRITNSALAAALVAVALLAALQMVPLPP